MARVRVVTQIELPSSALAPLQAYMCTSKPEAAGENYECAGFGQVLVVQALVETRRTSINAGRAHSTGSRYVERMLQLVALEILATPLISKIQVGGQYNLVRTLGIVRCQECTEPRAGDQISELDTNSVHDEYGVRYHMYGTTTIE